jgi:hypothetical protein
LGEVRRRIERAVADGTPQQLKQLQGQRGGPDPGRVEGRAFSRTSSLRAVDYQADQAALVLIDPHVVVVPIVAVHGAQVPWGKVVTNGVPVVAARRLPNMLRQLPAVLGPQRVTALANQARIRFRAAA